MPASFSLVWTCSNSRRVEPHNNCLYMLSSLNREAEAHRDCDHLHQELFPGVVIRNWYSNFPAPTEIISTQYSQLPDVSSRVRHWMW